MSFFTKSILYSSLASILLAILVYQDLVKLDLDFIFDNSGAQAGKGVSKDIKMATGSDIYSFKFKDIKGEEVSMEKYRNHVLIIVNVASKCGFTDSNYKELQQLYEKYESKGLRILAFPSNQFAGQEPGTEEDICTFTKKYNVTFDMTEKVNVNGDDTHPIWQFIKSKQGGLFGNFIKWNFTKFMVDKKGNVVSRYAPTTNPMSIEKEIEKYLNE